MRFADLNNDAMIAASHTCLMLALILLVIRLSRSFDEVFAQVAVKRGLIAGCAITAWAFAVERAYYVAARLLKPEYDLWSMHPAPLVLSAMVFLALYTMMAPIFYANYPKDRAQNRLALELCGFVLFWFLMVALL